MSLVAAIQQQNSVIICQRRELAELFGFETRNKYAIEDERGSTIGFAAEQGKGILGLLWRGFLGHWRSFDIVVFDNQRQPQMKIHHPFRFYFQRLEITTAGGHYLGALEKRFAILNKKFSLLGPDHQPLIEMNSPFWRFWTFIFKRGGQEVGRVEKKWSGLFSEALTDRDNFRVSFAPGLAAEERLLLVAAGFFVDILYFERKAN